MATEVKAVKTQRSSNSWIGLAIMAVLVIIGAIAWGVQLSKGMSVLGIGQIVVWGVYIAAFFTLVGLASGLLTLAVLADLNVIPGLKDSKRNLLIGALASYVAGGFMILMDIGKPERVLVMVFSPNIKSPFVWDFLSLALGVIMTLIYLLAPQKGKWLAILTGIVAGLIVVFEGWILSMTAGSPLWAGGMMPVMFLVEGIITALSVTLIAKPDGQASDVLRLGLMVFLPVLLLLNVFEIGSAMYAGNVNDLTGTNLILSNPIFWLEVVFGLIVPFILLNWAGKNRMAVMTAAVLALLGVFVAKTITVVTGQSVSFMMGTATYNPTITEFAGIIGVIGLAGLLYLLGTRYLPASKA